MEKMTKFISIAIIGILCFTGLIFFNYGLIPGQDAITDSISDDDEDEKNDTVKNIELIVDYSNGTTKTKEEFSLDDGKTSAFDALEKWCEVEYDVYPGDKYYVTNIDGRDKDDPDGSGWIYEVNGDGPSTEINHYYLESGDKVELIFKTT